MTVLRALGIPLAFFAAAAAFYLFRTSDESGRSDAPLCYTPSLSLNEEFTCPFSDGDYLLPRHFPATGIFVGYVHDRGHEELLRTLLGIARQSAPPMKLNILIPRHEVSIARRGLAALLQEPLSSFVNILPLPSDETLWAQDYMKVGADLAAMKPFFLDLPYIEREGESIPSALSLLCKIPLYDQPANYEKSAPDNGDYGGNIQPFPGDFIVVGNNITEETFRHTRETFARQEIVPIDVRWLETGHVDEIVTYIPDPGAKCGFRLLQASPRRAVELLNETKSWNRFIPDYEQNIFLDENYARHDFSSCFQNELVDSKRPECSKLISANETYARHIEDTVRRIRLEMEKRLNCRPIEASGLPVLFAPAETAAFYGSKTDYARAINPNSVNNILLNEHIVFPQQDNPHLQKEIEKTLERTGLKTHFVDSHLHLSLMGGIHCTSTVSRTCRRR